MLLVNCYFEKCSYFHSGQVFGDKDGLLVRVWHEQVRAVELVDAGQVALPRAFDRHREVLLVAGVLEREPTVSATN